MVAGLVFLPFGILRSVGTAVVIVLLGATAVVALVMLLLARRNHPNVSPEQPEGRERG